MSIYQNPTIIKIGDFFFKYRNKVFPLIIFALFVLAPPNSEVMGSRAIDKIIDIIAVLISFSGLFIRALVIGFAYIKRGGKNKQVYADNLVTEGMFTISRNPLYVGNMLIYFGIFLLHGKLPVVLIGTGLFYFIYICIIAAEERFLRTKFGAEYDAYCAKTSRWLIDFSRFGEATRDMHFNFMKVIVKDYPTIFTTIFIIIITQQYQYLTSYGVFDWSYEWKLIIMALICVLLTLGIRILKKKKILSYE